MLKKIASIALIVLVSFGTGAGLCYCFMNMDINKTGKETEAAEYKYIMYDVMNTEFENSISDIGTIEISDDEYYIDEYLLYYSQTIGANVSVKSGEIVDAGKTVGKSLVDGSLRDVKCSSAGKVVQIQDFPEEQYVCVKILNYDSLYFTVRMDYKQSKNFNYDSKVYYFADDGSKVNCNIDFIGYEIYDDNTIEIHVVPKDKKGLTPGISENLCFVIKETDKCLALAKEAVMEQNGIYTVLVKENGEYIEKEIEVGNPFGVIEDENTFYYYPILSGLQEGDIVYTRQIVSNSDTSGLEELLQ